MHHIDVISGEISNLKHADLIIWEDVVLCVRHHSEAVERTWKDFMRSIIALGGRSTVFQCEFQQVLFVVPPRSRVQIVAFCFYRVPIFRLLKFLCLLPNMRTFSLQQNPHAVEDSLAIRKYLPVVNGCQLVSLANRRFQDPAFRLS